MLLFLLSYIFFEMFSYPCLLLLLPTAHHQTLNSLRELWDAEGTLGRLEDVIFLKIWAQECSLENSETQDSFYLHKECLRCFHLYILPMCTVKIWQMINISINSCDMCFIFPFRLHLRPCWNRGHPSSCVLFPLLPLNSNKRVALLSCHMLFCGILGHSGSTGEVT